MKGYFNASLAGYHSCSSVPPLSGQAKNVHTRAAYFDPISIIDLWKENPLGLL